MRLTLRTLLAYMDQVLEPRDAEVLKGRIASSQLAASLVQRIRSGLKRRQLSAPPIIGRGLGGDPNTVAEYLDDMLEAERVPEFEKVCLESDVQLTEVAACHQVLTVVLGQPAELTADLRKRIVDLPNQPLPAFKKTKASAPAHPKATHPTSERRIDAAHLSSNPASPGAASETQSTVASNSASNSKIRGGQGIDLADHRLAEKVPEYLRGRASSTGRQVAIAGGLVGLLLVVSWLSLGSISSVIEMLGQSKSTLNKTVTSPNDAAAGGEQHGENHGQPANAGGANAASMVENTLDRANGGTGESEESSSAPVVDHGDEEHVGAGGDAVKGDASQPMLVAGKWIPESREQSESVVLLGLETPMLFRRAAIGDSLPANRTIIVPPAFQTDLQFDSDLSWRLRAATSLRAYPSTMAGSLVFDVDQTKAMIQALKQAEPKPTSLLLRIDATRDLQVTLKDASAIVALEIQPYWLLNNEWNVAKNVLRSTKLVVLEGEIQCQMIQADAPLGGPVSLVAGDGLGVVSEQKPVSFHVDQPPTWSVRSLEPPINKRAAEDLHRALLSTTPEKMVEQLRVLAMDRKPEVAALASRTLFLLGDFEAVMGEASRFRNPLMRAHWNSLVEDLRLAATGSESMLKGLQSRWDALQPDRSQLCLHLLTGYSPTQLEEGADQELLEALQSEDVTLRILAAYQLKRITGNDHGYLPEQPSPESIQQLRKIVTSGKLRYATSPLPFPEALP